MAGRRKYKKKGGKKIKKRTVKNSTSVGKELTYTQKLPLKPEFRTRLRYSGTQTMTSGALGVLGAQQQYRLNNVYDPDQSGLGHQPYGFDQLSPLYSKYRVEGVKVTQIWSTIGGNADMMTCYKIQCNSNAGNLNGITCDYATEQPATSTSYISPSGNVRVVEQNFYISMNKIFGITKKEYRSDDGYVSQSYSAGEPVKTAYLLQAVGIPSGGAAQDCTCQTIIEYDITFMERVDLAQF